MKHTKGEWLVLSDGLTIKSKIGHKPHYDSKPPQTLIAKCFQNGHLGRTERPTKEDLANAQLIAAAPDSVAACKEARTAIQEALIVIREVLNQYAEHDAAGRRGKLPIEKTLENAFVKVETAITKSELGG